MVARQEERHGERRQHVVAATNEVRAASSRIDEYGDATAISWVGSSPDANDTRDPEQREYGREHEEQDAPRGEACAAKSDSDQHDDERR